MEDYCQWQQANKAVRKRINDEHRIVYAVEKETVVIISCRGHYD
ncbi:MAG: type II toxin-antitoxin system YoeB family toxin [Eubacterium sp.]|nr:type II toxin-antitoxin system YoeB family toxin [Eubacterium sp.]